MKVIYKTDLVAIHFTYKEYVDQGFYPALRKVLKPIKFTPSVLVKFHLDDKVSTGRVAPIVIELDTIARDLQREVGSFRSKIEVRSERN